MTKTKEETLADLLQPSEALLNDVQKIKGDILILGAGGKMGPALALIARKAVEKTGGTNKIIAVSRFSDQAVAEKLTAAGIELIKADLLDDDALFDLPDADNVIYMAGHKFGTTGKEPYTWAMNSYLAGRVAEKYKKARIVVFSSGNIYPFTGIESGGATEETAPAPLGEYAQSCLGRERLFQYFSSIHNTPVLIYRLNYAVDVSYGVLLEIAKSVYEEKEIDLTMGYVNVIWQGDANEMAIRSLMHCSVPARIINFTGTETISVKRMAQNFGKLFDKIPKFTGTEQPEALLSNAQKSAAYFGQPQVSVAQMTHLIARWVQEGGATLDKPTHFQERKGIF
ncbi:NAD-dependent epimerase/dehydratase family protein [Niabella beijingensis]|uniref:NAD-dependent epimerase/dehydratase family protein n=1 Tax=Niabella beijingensis TaxID=2872700 RepID=UPI001CBF3266|nr:NAD-dependent epimerase/dehydratase family protein [Niabella beijingensis]MBZ4188603.1 NAD-dependent epimerase/dehydratase family protein [Niabella beijingensis]